MPTQSVATSDKLVFAADGDKSLYYGAQLKTEHIEDSAVTLGKMANLAAKSVIGNVGSSAAAPAAITLQTTGALNGTANQLADNAVVKAYVDAHIIDEDNMSSDSAVLPPSQQSVKKFVEDSLTAMDLDLKGDDDVALSIDLDSEVLDIAGGQSITTSGSGNTLTVAADLAAAAQNFNGSTRAEAKARLTGFVMSGSSTTSLVFHRSAALESELDTFGSGNVSGLSNMQIAILDSAGSDPKGRLFNVSAKAETELGGSSFGAFNASSVQIGSQTAGEFPTAVSLGDSQTIKISGSMKSALDSAYTTCLLYTSDAADE